VTPRFLTKRQTKKTNIQCISSSLDRTTGGDRWDPLRLRPRIQPMPGRRHPKRVATRVLQRLSYRPAWPERGQPARTIGHRHPRAAGRRVVIKRRPASIDIPAGILKGAKKDYGQSMIGIVLQSPDCGGGPGATPVRSYSALEHDIA
jgi:hypothetical protein